MRKSSKSNPICSMYGIWIPTLALKSNYPSPVVHFLVGGLEHLLCFHILGIILIIDLYIFQRVWNHQSDTYIYIHNIDLYMYIHVYTHYYIPDHPSHTVYVVGLAIFAVLVSVFFWWPGAAQPAGSMRRAATEHQDPAAGRWQVWRKMLGKSSRKRLVYGRFMVLY